MILLLVVTKSDLDLVRAIRNAEKRGEDVIAAGEAQQKLQRQQRATELQATPRTLGGGAQACSILQSSLYAIARANGPSCEPGERP